MGGETKHTPANYCTSKKPAVCTQNACLVLIGRILLEVPPQSSDRERSYGVCQKLKQTSCFTCTPSSRYELMVCSKQGSEFLSKEHLF